MTEYVGLLAIGDPHLASRVPGYRKDDYPKAVVEKLEFCIRYAREERLLPAVLGDLFEWPRDNSNWLLVSALSIFSQTEVIAIYGNHDCVTNTLGPDDSLQILVEAERLRLVTAESPWRGRFRGRNVVVGGTPYGQFLPRRRDPTSEDGSDPFVIWLTHHDLKLSGYDAGRLALTELPGIDLVVNGHIHRPLADVPCGQTTWLNPGNIARNTRGTAHESRIPSALRIDLVDGGWRKTAVPVPHKPYAEVFHLSSDPVADEAEAPAVSGYVRGLAELQAVRTHTGQALTDFLEQNLGAFAPEVSEEIRSLAKEVCRG